MQSEHHGYEKQAVARHRARSLGVAFFGVEVVADVVAEQSHRVS